MNLFPGWIVHQLLAPARVVTGAFLFQTSMFLLVQVQAIIFREGEVEALQENSFDSENVMHHLMDYIDYGHCFFGPKLAALDLTILNNAQIP